MGAIFKDNLGIARQLLRADREVDARNNAGQTPAMYAALFQRAELLQELREHGADMNAADYAGNTPSRRLAAGELNTTAR